MMAFRERKISKRRIAGSYVSSVLSISLMLLLVGVATLLLLSSRDVMDYFKRSLQVSVVLRNDISDAKASACRDALDTLSFVRSATLVSREEGTEELSKMLGADFLSVFETSPVPVSVDLTLEPGYVSSDSLEVVSALLSKNPAVDEVVVQKELADALNANLARISLVLGIFIILLLFISLALIGNTVRLDIQSRRFTIRAMQLVGATSRFIKTPFASRAALLGFISSLLALIELGAALYALKSSFSLLFEVFSIKVLLLSALVVVCFGIFVCTASTLSSMDKLLASDKDDLYY